MTITVDELKAWVNDNCILDSNSEWIGTIDTPSLYAKLDELDTSAERKLAEHKAWLEGELKRLDSLFDPKEPKDYERDGLYQGLHSALKNINKKEPENA